MGAARCRLCRPRILKHPATMPLMKEGKATTCQATGQPLSTMDSDQCVAATPIPWKASKRPRPITRYAAGDSGKRLRGTGSSTQHVHTETAVALMVQPLCLPMSIPIHALDDPSDSNSETNQADCDGASNASLDSGWSSACDTPDIGEMNYFDSCMAKKLVGNRLMANRLMQDWKEHRLSAGDAADLGICFTHDHLEILVNMMQPHKVHATDFMESDT